MSIKKNNKSTKNNFKTLIVYTLLLTLIFSFYIIPANSKVYFLEADYYQDKTQQRKLTLGKGEIISSDKEITRVAVSDPGIADLQVLGAKQIFVRAKRLGLCTFLAWEKEKTSPTRFDIEVWPDIDYLGKQLIALDPNITVDYIPPSSTSIADSGQGSSQGSSTGASSSQGSSSSSTSSSSSSTTGKIILKGAVSNAEVIARALQIAGAYVDDQGIKIISQPGGQVVDGLGGRYDIYSNTDSQGGASAGGSVTSFAARDPIRFTSNRYANLNRGVIATTQKGSVISFLTVKDSPQISIAIRFYEISRSVSRNIGFNTTLGGSTLQGGTFVGGNGISQPIGGIGSIANLSMFMAGTGNDAEFEFAHGSIAGGSFLAQTLGQGVTGVIFNPDNGVGAIIQALQERGEIKTLAEPNLVVANGEPASFLAGGEVPILRAVLTASGTGTDVSYEPFGIKFNVLPTLTAQNRIFLQLIPEIRDIDNELSNFVAPPGSTSIRPPAFRTRRTQTQVELESGQAFAISGLLREDNTRNLRKVPGVGDIPILGTLFRSKGFRKGETELLIVVSPQIVSPTKPDKVANLTKPELPYHDFDQVAPLKPYIQLDDEKGPDVKEPIDATRYYRPPAPKPPDLKKKAEQKQSVVPGQDPSIKKSKLDKKLEKEKLSKVIEEANLIRDGQVLKEKWQQESVKYAQAQEAMRLARQNKTP